MNKGMIRLFTNVHLVAESHSSDYAKCDILLMSLNDPPLPFGDSKPTTSHWARKTRRLLLGAEGHWEDIRKMGHFPQSEEWPFATRLV